MGLTELHWFENEEPELTERQLEDIVYENKRAYDSGYAKGYSARDNEIVRCKECKYGYHLVSTVNGEITIYRVLCSKPYIEKGNATHEPDWFCADGERKSNDG